MFVLPNRWEYNGIIKGTVAAVLIVGGTIAEDVITGGGGIADDAASFYLAYRLMFAL